MLYDKYQNKILKRAKLLQKLWRGLPIIITALALLIAVTVTVLVAKGTVYGVQVPVSLAYGDAGVFKVSAFLSPVHFEYSPKGTDEWSEEKPTMPGEYDVRTVSEGSFGKKIYGETQSFTIVQKHISVLLDGRTVVYGDVPKFYAALAYDDVLICEGYTYEDILAQNTKIRADIEKIRITDANGNDVTSAYVLSAPKCDVKILPKDINVLVEDVTHDYDGEEFKYENYELYESALAEGDVIQAKFEASLTEPGNIKNTPIISIINKDGFDVTHHYNINTSKVGNLTVKKRPLIIITESISVIYDGKAHFSANYTISENTSLLAGHKLVSEASVSRTLAGESENTMQFRVIDTATGEDITRYYSIIVSPGTITVNKRPVTVTTEDASWLYDGRFHSNPNFTVEGLADGHFCGVEGNMTYISEAGTAPNKFTVNIWDDDSFLTENYEITYVYGTLEVRKRQITICTASETWLYDAVPHFSSEVTIKGDGLLNGHTVTGSKMPSITNVGTVENIFIAEIVSSFEKYTSNYEITYEYGTLTVEPRPITLAPADVSKVYDGTPLFAEKGIIAEGSLALRHEISISVSGSATTVAESQNTKSQVTSFTITCDGEDISWNYAITVESGNITIEPRPIKVSSGSAEKVYDGSPLTKDEIFVIEDNANVYNLVQGHTISGTVTGSQTKIGKGKNTYSIETVKILNGVEDVTENYEFYEFDYGILLVKYPDTVYGKVKADVSGPLYLRMTSLGDYNGTLNANGKLWNEATEYPKLFADVVGYNYLATSAINRRFVETNFAEFSDMSIYMLPYYAQMADSNKTYIPSDTDYTTVDSSSPYTVEFFKINNFYDKLADIQRYSELGTYEEEYKNFVYANYLSIDDETRAYMNRIIRANDFSASDEDIIEKVASYIQNSAEYDLYYDTALDSEENVAIAFLRDYKTGNCTHYATAATLLFRALGIPARYVEGFLVNAEAGKTVEIKNPAHAWVEIYIDRVGWIYVEVTDGMEDEFGSGLYEGEEMPTSFIVQPLAYSAFGGTGVTLAADDEIEEFGNLKKLLDMGYTYKVDIVGSQTGIGSSETLVKSFVLYDPDGKNVTDEFEIEYRKGKLTVTQKLIKVYLHEVNKYYDGKTIEIDEDDYSYSFVSIIKNDATLELDFHIGMVDAGEITRTELNINMSDYLSYKVYLDGEDVTEQYHISFEILDGTENEAGHIPISIKKRPIEITAGSAAKLYDGTELTSDEVFISLGTLASGDKLTATTKGSQTEVGTSKNKIISATVTDKNGNNITRNYKIIANSGKLTVIGGDE